jgi:hypothetical protein
MLWKNCSRRSPTHLLATAVVMTFAVAFGVCPVASNAAANVIPSAHWQGDQQDGSSELASVSCPTVSWCLAVGVASNGPGTGKPLEVLITNGTAEFPGSLGGSVYPPAVACPSVAFCIVAGEKESESGGVPASALTDGTEFDQPVEGVLPSGAELGAFRSIWCSNIDHCLAVGGYETNIGSRALVERWNGARWYLEPLDAALASYPYAQLDSVSCTSLRFCMAVGASSTQAGATLSTHLLALTWNGRRWRVTPHLSQHPIDDLEGVSCTSVRFCIAVGDVGIEGFVERWNGSAWTFGPTLRIPARTVELGSLVCRSNEACTIVGTEKGLHTTGLLATLTSGGLTVGGLALVPALLGIADSSASSCVAVGGDAEFTTGQKSVVGTLPC